MTKRIELVFDFVSPNAYLIWTPLRAIAARHGAVIDVIPVFLAGMHRLTGNAPPMIRDAEVKGKNAYAQLEMDRFIAKHGLTNYRLHPQFPFNSITLQRMLVAACDDGRGVDFRRGVARADLGRGDRRLRPAGYRRGAEGLRVFDAADLFARAQTDAVKQALAANTDAVVERGAFGIPTMWVGDAMFFGKERLGQVEELLGEG